MRSDPFDGEAAAPLRKAFGDAPLGPPAGWDAVRAFEARHAIVLPEPFRRFVATVGDGCPSGPPFYGLVRLDHSVEPGNAPARPFPLTAPWLWEGAPEAGEAERLSAAAVEDGTLYLGTDGCAMDWRLVVTGRHRGHVWQFTDVGVQPFGAPFGHTTAAPGFGGWVRHWAAGRDWFDAPESHAAGA
ncbi:hypothetical protein [Actinomadura vinacea]